MKEKTEIGAGLLLLAPALGPVAATETPAEADEVPDRHSREIVEKHRRRLLWAGEGEDGKPEWFDVTGSTVDPHRFQVGIGKDTIPSIDAPEFLSFDDPRLAARGVTRETRVLGVEIVGIARAYPRRRDESP